MEKLPTEASRVEVEKPQIASLNVLRSSGEMDDGWQVNRVEGQYTFVNKEHQGDILEKKVRTEDLNMWNQEPETEGLDEVTHERLEELQEAMAEDIGEIALEVSGIQSPEEVASEPEQDIADEPEFVEQITPAVEDIIDDVIENVEAEPEAANVEQDMTGLEQHMIDLEYGHKRRVEAILDELDNTKMQAAGRVDRFLGEATSTYGSMSAMLESSANDVDVLLTKARYGDFTPRDFVKILRNRNAEGVLYGAVNRIETAKSDARSISAVLDRLSGDAHETDSKITSERQLYQQAMHEAKGEEGAASGHHAETTEDDATVQTINSVSWVAQELREGIIGMASQSEEVLTKVRALSGKFGRMLDQITQENRIDDSQIVAVTNELRALADTARGQAESLLKLDESVSRLRSLDLMQ